MKLAKFNPEGIRRFSDMLRQMRAGTRLAPDRSLLALPELVESPGGNPIEVPEWLFVNRDEAARKLDELFTKASLSKVALHDAGLWAWLSLYWFDALCPPIRGAYKVQDDARYIPGTTWRKFYRHLLMGAWRVWSVHRDQPLVARIVLCQPVHRPGDVVEQLTSRQEFVLRAELLKVTDRLYFDSSENCVKRGATAKRDKPGSLRRFVSVIQQLELTYNIYNMECEKILARLPAEFDGWSSENRYEVGLSQVIGLPATPWPLIGPLAALR